MKKLRSFVGICSILAALACNADDPDSKDRQEIDVQTYIDLLKKGDYESTDLPPFFHKDIPALLEHCENQDIIQNFPVNPLASLSRRSCTLGMFVLWTIESIRVVEDTDSEPMIMRFPSKYPILALRNVNELTLKEDVGSHQVAARAYIGWWQQNEIVGIDKIMSEDPLKNTPYQWY